MTLIKKISQLHKSASTANLLSMALIMSAVSCGCDDKDGDKGGEAEFKLTYTRPGTATPKASKEQELTIGFEATKEGTFDPSKWTIATKDLKGFDDAGVEVPAVKPTCDKENKSLKDAGITDEKLAKDTKKDFKVKIASAEASFTKLKDGKVTGTLQVKGKKMKDGKETDTDVPIAIEFLIGS
jgi:hypothetical protein